MKSFICSVIIWAYVRLRMLIGKDKDIFRHFFLGDLFVVLQYRLSDDMYRLSIRDLVSCKNEVLMCNSNKFRIKVFRFIYDFMRY